MTDVHHVLSESEVEEIKNKVDRIEEDKEAFDGQALNCRHAQPEESEFIGAGRNRCVYEKDDNIIKIARHDLGRAENMSARQVKENISTENTHAFAMPKYIDNSNTVMITEKLDNREVDSFHMNTIDKRLRKAKEEDNIYCEDVEPHNVGFKGSGPGTPALIDLGMCSKVDKENL